MSARVPTTSCKKCHGLHAEPRDEGCTWVHVREQAPPTPNDRANIWPLVIADMQQRDIDGTAKYGTPLQAHNGRDPLIDAYQEALDLCVYLRQAIEERKSHG